MSVKFTEEVNKIRDQLFATINGAGIKNLAPRMFTCNVYKRAIPDNFGAEDCPLISIFKTSATGRNIDTDQADVDYPRRIRFTIGISDFSQVDLDDAEKYTDDLIDKVIAELEKDPTLNSLVKGIEISSITFNEDRRNGVWFSEPSMEIEVESIAL